MVRAVDHQDGPVEADLWVFEWKDSAAKRAVADGGFTNETSSSDGVVVRWPWPTSPKHRPTRHGFELSERVGRTRQTLGLNS